MAYQKQSLPSSLFRTDVLEPQKKVLVLSGGGSRGAYEAGVIYHLMCEREIDYDLVIGISVGSLIALRLAQYSKGQQIQAAEQLKLDWHAIKTSQVLKSWFFGYAQGYFKGSLKNSKPLRDYIEKTVDLEAVQVSDRQALFGTVSLTSGEVFYLSKDCPDLVGAVLASSSFPGFMNPVSLKFKDEEHFFTDGGVKDINPIGQAFKHGATRIDAISVGVESATVKGPVQNAHLVDVLKSVLSSMSDEVARTDVSEALLVNEILALRQVIADAGLTHRISDFPDRSHQKVARVFRFFPTVQLSYDSLAFDPAQLAWAWRQGLEEARQATRENPDYFPESV